MRRWGLISLLGMPILLAAGGPARQGSARRADPPATAPGPSEGRETVARFVDSFCVECHNREDRTAGLAAR